MNTIQSIFCGTQYKNHNIKKQADNKDKTGLQADKPALSKASPDNYKANYMVSFKGGMKYEESDKSNIGTINHQTAFFREQKTDEIVQRYILEKFGSEDEINIVSGACSTGEEAKSYAMMLDSIKDKLNIYGFDISADVVEDAKKGDCQLVRAKDNALGFTTDLDSENMLLDNSTQGLTDYQRNCRDKFNRYYTPKGPEYSVPVFPDAKQKLKDLEALLNNPEEFKKQKKEYDDQIQTLKREHPEVAEFVENMSFEDTVEMGMASLKSQVQAYRSVRDFSTDMSQFGNCSFAQGDVMNLDKLYDSNSVNVLLYRNALYHTLCTGDNMLRFMKEDAKDTMDVIAKQMNKVLKPRGLVVFGEKELLQGVDGNVIKEVMENNGFKSLQEGTDNIWVKVGDTETV